VADDGSAWGEYSPSIRVPSANAALIAAAPLMLEALEEILLRACYGIEEDTAAAPEMLRAAFDTSRAAIAAAKGESP
jgi:hypothetical protein